MCHRSSCLSSRTSATTSSYAKPSTRLKPDHTPCCLVQQASGSKRAVQLLNGHAGKRPRGATGTRSALSQARGGLPPRAGRGGSGSYSPPEMPAEGVSHHQHRTDSGSMVIWPSMSLLCGTRRTSVSCLCSRAEHRGALVIVSTFHVPLADRGRGRGSCGTHLGQGHAVAHDSRKHV